MAGIYTKIGIGVTLLTFILFITAWSMAQMAQSYGVTIEDLYLENSEDLREQSAIITESSLTISEESSLDQESTDAAQAQGDISAIKEYAGMKDIAFQALENVSNILPYNAAINVLIITLFSILLASGILYAITGRRP